MMGHYSSHRHLDGTLFLPQTPMMGHYCSHRHQCWDTIPPTDINDGALFLPH
ncbi:unnamed protein product [Staurois parvus]|uniref:Uncharacterized protein n=1 Tax=Staurois parvus TaxID=386267 RepID=A0ABN9FN36_9NEOB|nr:unnamed protein product [Staurois parvus]